MPSFGREQTDFNDIPDLVSYYTNLYYLNAEKDISVRHNEYQHGVLIQEIDSLYKKRLKKLSQSSEGFDYDLYENTFIENINNLTGFFDKKEAAEHKRQQAKDIMDNFKNYSNASEH